MDVPEGQRKVGACNGNAAGSGDIPAMILLQSSRDRASVGCLWLMQSDNVIGAGSCGGGALVE